ncbi:MAG: tyrosine--tRNA ligase [Planctomycetaceae bacterium]|nr:tyrosine--tRNA ligase [Planctomycetaceae bacterium]
MQSILQELQWRGLIHQSTESKELAQQLDKPTVVYAGFDPTADSLHVGSLLPLMMLRRFQQAGHRPVALVGGATGMIGDPSGKTDERQLLSKDVLQANVDGIRNQLGHFLEFTGPNAAILVNNLDWMHGFSFLDFLRDVGKNFPINVMLTKDSVKSRLERTDSGLSYTEFSYMLLQAYDFVHLAKHHDCLLQIGGSDQWGNITAGIDLGRRMLSRSLYGLTCPLLTTSDGKKMGKTEKGAVWLSGERTSPFEFYQYFINVADADVLMTLRFLSDVSQEEYRELEAQMKDKPQERAAQTRLAESLTRLVHGQSKLDAVQHATKLLFGADITQLTQDQLNTIFEDVPSQEVPRNRLAEAVTEGAAYLNNQKVTAFDRVLTESDLAGKYLILRAGKKRYGLLRFV